VRKWRKCVGIEPTGPAARDPQDLKSWADTSPQALPPESLPQVTSFCKAFWMTDSRWTLEEKLGRMM